MQSSPDPIAVLEAPAIEQLLLRPGLVEAFTNSYHTAASSPLRQRIDFGEGAELLVMSAVSTQFAAVKALTIVPANAARGIATIQGQVMFFDGRSGRALAAMDAGPVTAFRTAVVSACAARHLARVEASRLLVLGSGHLGPYLAWGHAQVRPIRRIAFWGRSEERAIDAARRARDLIGDARIEIVAATSLAQETEGADIVSTATRSLVPLLSSQWIRPGTHLDLVGAYRPDMREVDDATLARAAIYVDTLDGARAEAGDLIGPLARGVIEPTAVIGELSDLLARSPPLRHDLSIFKAVGTARADLAIAQIIWERMRECQPL